MSKQLKDKIWNSLQELLKEMEGVERSEKARLLAISRTHLEASLIYYEEAQKQG